MSTDDARAVLRDLTIAECRVLYWLCQGLTRKQIASKLVVTESTVYFHLGNIYQKLGLDGLGRSERQLMLGGLYCPLHLEEVRDPETDCQRLREKEKESDRTPSKEALALVRQDEETGLIPLRKDLVPAASDVPIRWPPVVIIREQASRRPGRRLPWQILVIMAACVLLGAGLALLLLRPFLRQPVAALLPSPTQATLAKTLLTAVATAQPPTSVPTITSIPTPTDTLAPSPTYTPTSTRTPQPTSTPMPWKAVGESWEQDGAVLTLKEVEFFTKEPFWGDEAILVCRLTFTNKTGQDILVQVRFADFKLVDNLGNSYAFADEVENRILLMPRDGSYRGMFRSLMVKPDQDVNWPLAYGPQPNEKPLPTDADYFVLRVEKFSRIPLAGWKIDIPK